MTSDAVDTSPVPVVSADEETFAVAAESEVVVPVAAVKVPL